MHDSDWFIRFLNVIKQATTFGVVTFEEITMMTLMIFNEYNCISLI